jgi:Cft2 family RNA processing exonuclease
MPIRGGQSPEEWIHILTKFITSCGYTLDKFFAIGNWCRYQSTLLRLVEHVIAIDVNDVSKQAADAVIIQAMLEETEQPIRSEHTLILISGDSDFSDTVKLVQSRGRQVFLIHGEYNRTSNKLLEIVDYRSSFNDIFGRKRKSEAQHGGSSSKRRYI